MLRRGGGQAVNWARIGVGYLRKDKDHKRQDESSPR